jgi:hypothetical protein
MQPPIKDLLPRLTPILKNRHEKVQENCIDLVGRIADRGAEFVSSKEWMRICFEVGFVRRGLVGEVDEAMEGEGGGSVFAGALC